MRLTSPRGLAAAVLGIAIAFAAPLVAAPGADVKGAIDELRKSINASDNDGTDRAIAKLRGIGGKDAVEELVELAAKIPPGAETTYWRLVNGAAGFRDDEGLRAVAKAILDKKGGAISRDLMFALANNRVAGVATIVYATILDKGTDELRLMAADALCGIEYPEAVDVIISVLKKEEKKKGEIYARLIAGIKFLTGADCGSADAWDAWWKGGGRAQGLKGRAKRDSNTGTVVDEVEGPRTEDVTNLHKIAKEKIVVLHAVCKKDPRACNYDDMDSLLNQMNIPHINVDKADLDSGKWNGLDKAMAVLLTCTQNNEHCVCPTCVPGGSSAGNRMVQCTGCDKHEAVNHKLSGNSVKKLKEWVERGGYLFSEDWGLKDAIEPAWPNLVKQGKMMKERKVPCSPSRGRTSHPLLRGVFIDPAAKPVIEQAPEGEGGGTVERQPPSMENVKIERTWTIDDDSPFIDVVNKQVVVTLMESDVLAKEGSSAVAITFLPTSGEQGEKRAATGMSEKIQGGRVLHVLSHFGKQQDQKDEFALQNMLLNFLMEGHRRSKGAKN